MLLTPDWLAEFQSRVGSAVFAQARSSLAKEAEGFRAFLPDLPERQAGYYHEFFCPDHAVGLIFDPREPSHHVCPQDGAVFSGEPFDSAWRWSVNDRLSDAALRLAVHSILPAWDDPGAPEKASGDRGIVRHILEGYADRYRTMPPAFEEHGHHPGVVTWSGLDESVWIIRLAWAHAIVEDSLSAELNQHIREDLLRPASDHLFRVLYPGIHNATNWNNAAIITLSLALEDAERLQQVLQGPNGLYAQLREGVGSDGFWWEGSLSYHYYTLAALVWTVRALRSSGHSFEDDGTLPNMFRAPIFQAFPDLTLPAINDCWSFIKLTGRVGHGIPSSPEFYETAWAWYGEPEFAWVLNQNVPLQERTGLEVLLDGVEEISEAAEPVFEGSHMVDSGVAIFRSSGPREQQSYLLLKAGPDGGVHGHPDQLGIQLFVQGERLTSDLGTPGYGIDLNESWYRQTASHSTVTLDGRSQPPGVGQVRTFWTGPEFGVVDGTVTWDEGDYAGVRLRRVLLWREPYFVDVFDVECADSRCADWIYHNRGSLVEVSAGQPQREGLSGEGGYGHFDELVRLEQNGGNRLVWEMGKARLEFYWPQQEDAEVMVGTAPSNPASETLSVLIRRLTSSRSRFLGLFVPGQVGGVSRILGPPGWEMDGGTCRLTVNTPQGNDLWLIGTDPAAAQLSAR